MTKEKHEINRKKQLIIFINPEPNEDMGDRVKLFTQHVIARGNSINADNYAYMLTKEPNLIAIQTSDVTQSELGNALEFKSIVNKLQEQNLLKPLTDEEKNNIDQIVIISTGVSDSNGKNYASFNGLDSQYHSHLIKNIQNIINYHLKDDGMVRVQICHSGTRTIMVEGKEKVFSEAIKPEEKSTLKVSAPPSYSIISEQDGRVIDLQIADKKNFRFFAASGKRYLNKMHSDSTVIGFFHSYLTKETKRFYPVLKEVYLVFPNGSQKKIAERREKLQSFDTNDFIAKNFQKC